MPKPTAEDLEELTDDERAALEDIDEAEEAAEAAAQATGDADADKAEAKAAGDDDADAEDGDSDDADADTDAAQADAAAADGDAGQAAVEPEAPAEASPVDALPVLPQAPADADAKLADIERRREELAQKFDDGDLSTKELLAEQQKLTDEAFEIKMAVRDAHNAVETAKTSWDETIVPDFLARHTQYDAKDNETLFNMLNAEVTRRQQAALDAGRNPFVPSILNDAHAAILESVAKLTGQPVPKTETREETRRQSTHPDIPPTLANVPAAEHNDVDDGKFAQLDRLSDRDPIAYEEAFAALPAADREAYLARQ